ncbi:MAG: GNAT family N-acetyltransferase [Chromatiales bacterium]|jgi:GNAT superfamily N-acetyltransferase
MTVQLAKDDRDILACYPLIRELRPHIGEAQFLSHARSQEKTGYQLAFVIAEDELMAVAGFRIGENLAWGRFLYVDDLVTLPAHRSKGHGAKLLAWLKVYAAAAGCLQMHLDSGLQRLEAHRFYEREGMSVSGYHFFIPI